jgi:tRNA-specific 2-thiouridylase
MTSNQGKTRALGLCSGGLDSMLAGLVLREQGIEVEWVTFETPFFNAAKAGKASRITGIPLTVKAIYPVYIEMLKNPPAGYGKYMNPCMDCHALMFKLAGAIMRAREFDFLFSGEVLGQRPMSQNKTSLRYVEKHSGFDGYILRPLTAKNLPETIPEKEGLVDRELLLDIAGRGRKDQIKLAEKFGIKDYPAPAGGCLLTDVGYTNR